MSGLPRDRRERDIIIEDESLAAGFTQIPNQLLRRPGLSPGAKLTYVMLLSYAWQDDACFPGQETLARDVGVTGRSIRTYMRELEEAKLITIKQRGLNLTNLYVLHRIPTGGPEDISVQERKPSLGPEDISDQDRKGSAGQDRKAFPTTNTQSDNTQKTNDSGQEPIEVDAAPFPIPELGLSSAQLWHALLDAVEHRATFPRSEIDTWLRPARLAGRDGDALLIAAPNAVARDRLDARMLPQLRSVAADMFGTSVALRVVVG